jgi:hypothetical protein
VTDDAYQKQLLAQGEKTLSQRDKLILATRQLTAAQLASAMINSSGQAHDLAATMRAFTDVWFSLFPQSGQARYEEWAREHRSAISPVQE